MTFIEVGHCQSLSWEKLFIVNDFSWKKFSVVKNQRDKDTDIYKEIEFSIYIYVLRLKMNSCLLHFSRLLVTNLGNSIHTIWVVLNKIARWWDKCDKKFPLLLLRNLELPLFLYVTLRIRTGWQADRKKWKSRWNTKPSCHMLFKNVLTIKNWVLEVIILWIVPSNDPLNPLK